MTTTKPCLLDTLEPIEEKIKNFPLNCGQFYDDDSDGKNGFLYDLDGWSIDVDWSAYGYSHRSGNGYDSPYERGYSGIDITLTKFDVSYCDEETDEEVTFTKEELDEYEKAVLKMLYRLYDELY